MRVLLLIIIVTHLIKQGAFASIVICVYNNGAIYLAADSRVTAVAKTANTISATPKLLKFQKTCCAAITGNYGSDFYSKDTGKLIADINLLTELRIICERDYSSTERLTFRIKSVCNTLSESYAGFTELCRLTGLKADGASLMFAGYDNERTNFFVSVYYIGKTNNPPFVEVFNSGTSSTYLGVMGEDAFLGAVLFSPQDLPNKVEQSDELRVVLSSIRLGVPISESRMKQTILALFELHKKYATSMSADKGWIGEPYLIYEITKTEVKQLQ